MSEDFLKHLMNHVLVECVKIPKVQVERIIGPILTLFLPEILNEYYRNDLIFNGMYEIISEEFPLRKIYDRKKTSVNSSFQSTNIDFLLLNKEKNFIVFLELKTDRNWRLGDQLENYLYYKNLINRKSAAILFNELDKIKRRSDYPDKYDYLIKKSNEYRNYLNDIYNVRIVYLVPNHRAIKDIDEIIYFNKLPPKIDHKFSNEWTIIHEYLSMLCIDKIEHKTKDAVSKSFDKKQIIKNVQQYIAESSQSLMPKSISIGILGEGSRPNYQIEFSNGEVKTFYYSGKLHRIKKFKDGNITSPIDWEEFQKI